MAPRSAACRSAAAPSGALGARGGDGRVPPAFSPSCEAARSGGVVSVMAWLLTRTHASRAGYSAATQVPRGQRPTRRHALHIILRSQARVAMEPRARGASVAPTAAPLHLLHSLRDALAAAASTAAAVEPATMWVHAVAVAISVALLGACAQARMLQQATVIVVNQPQVIVPVRLRMQGSPRARCLTHGKRHTARSTTGG